jgi:CRP/FNR family transcriptional regulator
MQLTEDCQTCALRKDGFFCQLSPAPLKAFQHARFSSSYPASAVLFVEGQAARGVYEICKGRVKLTMTSLEGKTVIVRIASAGELLGLHSTLSGDPFEVTAETLEPCQVNFVRRDDFLKLVRDNHEACVNAMSQLSNFYRGACQQIRYLALTHSATEKLARFLLESASRGQETKLGVRFNLSLTHEEIAQIIGISRETVTRALTELRNKMLISTNGPSVVIRNRQALEAMAAA